MAFHWHMKNNVSLNWQHLACGTGQENNVVFLFLFLLFVCLWSVNIWPPKPQVSVTEDLFVLLFVRFEKHIPLWDFSTERIGVAEKVSLRSTQLFLKLLTFSLILLCYKHTAHTQTHTFTCMDEYSLLSLFSAASFSVFKADHLALFNLWGSLLLKKTHLSHQPMFTCNSPFSAGLVPSSMIFGSSFQGDLQLISDKI